MCRVKPVKQLPIPHFVREDDESMKPPSNVKTPAQYIASHALPAAQLLTALVIIVELGGGGEVFGVSILR